ncbi:unnamed protein product [Auanema sp. JU1783]|nr:unnamed protein product [Auanema sp. JU1783]
MESEYSTPIRSPARSRRKALSPRPQVIDLDIVDETENHSGTLKEKDEMIRILKDSNKNLHETITITESVSITESKRRTSHIETKTGKEVELLEREVSFLRKRVQELEAECNREVTKNTDLQNELLNYKRNRTDNEGYLESLYKDAKIEITKLQGKILEQSREHARSISQYTSQISELEDKIMKANFEKEELLGKISTLKSALEETQAFKAKFEDFLEKSGNKEDADKSTVFLNEIRTLRTHIINTPKRTVSRLSNETKDLYEEVGSLKATVAYTNAKMAEMEKKEEQLLKEIDCWKDKENVSKREIDELSKKIEEIEGSQHITNKYLVDEAEKVKQQKADMRLQLIQLQREHETLKTKCQELEKNAIDAKALDAVQIELTEALTERSRLERENNKLLDQIKSLESTTSELEHKINLLNDELEIALKHSIDTNDLKEENTRLVSRLASLKKILDEVDAQCEQYRARKIKAEDETKKTRSEMETLSSKIREFEMSLSKMKTMESELHQLRGEKDRLVLKNRNLTEEIKEIHADYRSELSHLAKEREQQQQLKNAAPLQSSFKLNELEDQLKKNESLIKSTERRLKEQTELNEKLLSQVDQITGREKKIAEENANLLQGLSDAVSKIEKYKKDADDLRELNQSMAQEIAVMKENNDTYEEEITSLSEALNQHENLTAYLQSQVNTKQLPKVSRRSTLLRTPSEVSMNFTEIVDPVIVEDLEIQKSVLLLELEEKRKKLTERKEMPPPAVPVHQPTAPSASLNSSEEKLNKIVEEPERAKSLSSIIRPQGTMRHDIPHRWKDLRNLGLFSIKCAVCFIGVSTFGKARRCTHCNVIVHTQCSVRVVNTCGLPDQCANFYLDNHTVPNGKLNGWIKLFCDDSGSREWQTAWVMMDRKSLSFYNHDNVSDLTKPFLRIDLEKEQFVVRAGADVPLQIRSAEKAYTSGIILLKMNGRNVYMLAQSIGTAKKWAEALQSAQTRRMVLTRKPSSFSEQSCLLVLSAPNNLTIHTTAILDDYLIIGAQGGLFFTQVSSPRVPLRVSGLNSVIAMEIIEELNIIAMIVGSTRSLALLPISTLKSQLMSITPAIRPDMINGCDHLHLLKYHENNGQRYLCAADSSKIQLLKYNSTRDVFVIYQSISTNEPAMCIESSPTGLFFGTDTFYSVDLSRNPCEGRSLVSTHVADYPINILPISENELLLAYQNYGMFVNTQGTKTREKLIEWEQMPMEFIYTAPFLYIVHYDSIEIVRVAEWKGANSATIMDEREVFECQNAHIIGRQRNGDIYMSISNKESTEVHRFNARNQKKPTMKRKGLSFSALHDKRTKL